MASRALSVAADPPTFKILDKLDGQFCNAPVLVRLIHFWEARNFKKANILMGVELLLLDAESNAVQGFISANQLPDHEHRLKRGSVYKLNKFKVRPAKTLYRVSDHKHTICFTDLTTMAEIHDGEHKIDAQKFRVRVFEDFAPIADTDIDLFDVIGQLRLISGDNLQTPGATVPATEVADNRSKDRVFLHLQMEDGQTIRVNLWGNIAGGFRERWNKSDSQPGVVLITTVNPKNIGGALTLNSTSATRLFFDADIAETHQFMTRVGGAGEHITAVTTASSAITKYETVTISEIHQFLQGEPQEVSFYCLATVTDILGQYGWHYISCTKSGCNTKLGKTETSLYCTTCKKTSNVGLVRYRFEIAVCDRNGDVATFVLFDGDGKNIAGRNAGDVLEDALEAAGEDGHQAINTAAPACLKSIIGRICKFQIKIKVYNFTASRQTFTVSRIITDVAEMETEATEKSLPEDGKTDPAELNASVTTAGVGVEHGETVQKEKPYVDPKRSVKDLEVNFDEESGDKQKDKRPRIED